MSENWKKNEKGKERKTNKKVDCYESSHVNWQVLLVSSWRLACVSPSDRAGEPAGCSGPGPAGLPQPLGRDPHAALQPDRRTVSAAAPTALSAGCWRYLEAPRSEKSLCCSTLQGEGNLRQTQERVCCQASPVAGFLPQREPQRRNPRSSFSRWEPRLEACSLHRQSGTSPEADLFVFVVVPKCLFQSSIEYERFSLSYWHY